MKNLILCTLSFFFGLFSYSQTTWQVCVSEVLSTGACNSNSGIFTPGNLVINQGDQIQFTTYMILLGGYNGTHNIQFTGSPANNVMLPISTNILAPITTVTTPPFNTVGTFPMECIDGNHCFIADILEGWPCTGYSVTVLPSCAANSNFTASSLNVCTGEIVNFTNTSTGAIGYTWHLDEATFATSTNSSLNFSTAGAYEVELIANGGMGCLDSNTITINVTQAANAGMDASQTFCNIQDSIDLNTLLTGTLSGAWNETTSSGQFNTSSGYFDYSNLSAGSYFFDYVIAGTGACTNDVAEMSITINQSPQVALNVSPNSVDLIDSVYVDFTTNGLLPGATYLWNFCDGNTVGYSSPFYYSWGATGLLCVCVTVNNGNGCVQTFCDSSMVVFDASGLNELNEQKIKIYPNPAKEILFIDLTNVSSVSIIRIYDEASRLIIEENAKGTSIHEIGVNQLVKGIYFVQIISGNDTSILPLVIE